MKNLLFILLLSTAILCSCEKIEQPELYPLVQTIEINQNIYTNTTFFGGTRYLIKYNIELSDSAILTINPGAIVIFEGTTFYTSEYSGASIQAIGTADSLVQFKGVGFYNGYQNNQGYISLAGGISSTFEFCSFDDVAITEQNARMTINNCHFQECSFGVQIYNYGFKEFDFNTFSSVENHNTCIHIGLDQVYTLGGNNEYDSHQQIKVESEYEYISGVHQWKAQTAPLVFYDDLIISNSGYDQLTIDPGSTLQFQDGSFQVSGVLIAKGTESRPITFEAYPSTSSTHYWEGIKFQGFPNSSEMTYCVIKNGGQGGWSTQANIYIQSNSLNSIRISNCTISDSYGYGIFSQTGAIPPYVSQNQYSNNTTANFNW